MLTTAPAFFSTAAISSLNHHPGASVFNVSATASTTIHSSFYPTPVPRPPRVLPGGAQRRTFGSLLRALDSTALAVLSEEEEAAVAAAGKIGTRVRVKVPLKVYHVPRVPEVDLTGKEGVLKKYVAVWKGKRISANLPFKVEFVVEVEGRGPVKFSAHLREDEFEYLD